MSRICFGTIGNYTILKQLIYISEIKSVLGLFEIKRFQTVAAKEKAAKRAVAVILPFTKCQTFVETVGLGPLNE